MEAPEKWKTGYLQDVELTSSLISDLHNSDAILLGAAT